MGQVLTDTSDAESRSCLFLATEALIDVGRCAMNQSQGLWASLKDLVARLDSPCRVRVSLSSSGLVCLLKLGDPFKVMALIPVLLPFFQPLLHDRE